MRVRCKRSLLYIRYWGIKSRLYGTSTFYFNVEYILNHLLLARLDENERRTPIFATYQSGFRMFLCSSMQLFPVWRRRRPIRKQEVNDWVQARCHTTTKRIHIRILVQCWWMFHLVNCLPTPPQYSWTLVILGQIESGWPTNFHRRFYRLGVPRMKKSKGVGVAATRFMAEAPNFPSFLFINGTVIISGYRVRTDIVRK